MTTRDEIVEAMAKTIRESNAYGCGCCAWTDNDGTPRDEYLAAEVLDTALPLIQQALAEKVRDARAGNGFRDTVLDTAARLIEEGLEG